MLFAVFIKGGAQCARLRQEHRRADAGAAAHGADDALQRVFPHLLAVACEDARTDLNFLYFCCIKKPPVIGGFFDIIPLHDL